jgi:error-prone DNA polymerase
MSGPQYAELQVTSHFSFLRGASSCEELFATAAILGVEALAVVDRNSLAGVVRAHEAAKATGVRLVVGCRLDLSGSESVLVYPTDRGSYARLCRLLSLRKKRAGKAKCDLAWADLVAYGEGLIAVLVPDQADQDCALRLRRLREAFGDRGYVALSLRRRPNDQLLLFELSNLATSMRVPTIVTNDVLFHEPRRRILQDVVTCIRHNVTIDELGDRRERHTDRYLKSPEEMHRLFVRYPEALARTVEIVDRCSFSLDELAYQYPEERADPSLTPQETLENLTWEGAAWRYPEGLPDDVLKTLRHELDLIEKLRYAPYFLTVHAIVRFARSKDILCQGRGSAANSAVCYVLGITSIDPARNDLLFERFVSEERHEPPDIDVDFEHERREIVMQWIFDQYGRDHAALCSTVIRYRTKGAIRDVGKVLGLTEDLIKMLSSQVWGWSEEGVEEKHVEALNLNLSDRRLRLALDLARQLMGAPRHLSQHPGGFVLTHDRLDDLVPIEPAAMIDRQVIEWDKDDIDALKFMKVDVLALGMLTCMKKAFDFLAEHKGVNLDLATIPAEDPRTYAMIRKRTRWAPSRSRAGRRCRCCRASNPEPSMIWWSRWRSCGQARSRAPWCIPICAGAKGLSPSSTRSLNWSRFLARPSACRCFRSKPCASPLSAPASRPARPTSSGRAWRLSSSLAASLLSATSSSPAWSPTVTSRSSRRRPSNSSKALAAMDFLNLTQLLLR